jgi:hypothetical protein
VYGSELSIAASVVLVLVVVVAARVVEVGVVGPDWRAGLPVQAARAAQPKRSQTEAGGRL